MSKITFLATGLGILHPDYQTQMKMRFLMDTEHHDLRIKTQRKSGAVADIQSKRTYFLGDKSVEIKVELDSGVTPIPNTDPAKILEPNIMDLNKLHFPVSGTTTRLRDRTNPKPKPTSNLTIDNALPYSEKLTKKYEIWRLVEDTGVPTTQTLIETRAVTLKIGTDFNIPSGKKVRVTVTGEESFLLEFSHIAGIDYVVEFNNDCDSQEHKEKCSGDDFHLYYDVLDNKDGTKTIEIRETLDKITAINDTLACNPPIGGGG